MIQVGSILKVCDKTGVSLVQCIKVFGSYKKRIAYIGDVILVSVVHINPKKFKNMKIFKRKRFFKGTLHRGLILRTKVQYKRANKIYIKFNENSIVLVNRKVVPISNRVYGPVLLELCRKLPSLGCISRYMI
jgi:large subunit ribosomal protein L14